MKFGENIFQFINVLKTFTPSLVANFYLCDKLEGNDFRTASSDEHSIQRELRDYNICATPWFFTKL